MTWSFITSFGIPGGIIIFIWITMAHHFTMVQSNANRYLIKPGQQKLPFRSLQQITLKMVLFTALCMTSMILFGLTQMAATIQTPKSTRGMDFTLLLALAHSMIQPILHPSSPK